MATTPIQFLRKDYLPKAFLRIRGTPVTDLEVLVLKVFDRFSPEKTFFSSSFERIDNAPRIKTFLFARWTTLKNPSPSDFSRYLTFFFLHKKFFLSMKISFKGKYYFIDLSVKTGKNPKTPPCLDLVIYYFDAEMVATLSEVIAK